MKKYNSIFKENSKYKELLNIIEGISDKIVHVMITKSPNDFYSRIPKASINIQGDSILFESSTDSDALTPCIMVTKSNFSSFEVYEPGELISTYKVIHIISKIGSKLEIRWIVRKQ